MSKYKHEERIHNLRDANIIVPEMIELLAPESVVDFGCGLGTFIHVFKRLGVNDILGIDGSWVNKELLYSYIEPNEFFESDLENIIILDKKYDLVLSLEVAEHLTEESATTFVENLINSGNAILFSAAIPYQGGQNHINEQWITFWEKKFLEHDFIIHDVIRPIFWDNPEIFWWYKQNLVLITHKDYKLKFIKESVPMRNIVHYELYLLKSKELYEKSIMLKEIVTGKVKSIYYFKWFLYSIFGFDFIKRLKKRFKNP
ncbi:class I SAM-dependent methyltransferase [Confluentibacter lentus]|uniref:class I SAM-dependent methyltransferase n=1 Tax=Confluentibacter lentus TaxID=1699412 RepID=UPI000C2906EA|nr:class I SAM-dependent methyltransferase [Confluentibacter lentus]